VKLAFLRCRCFGLLREDFSNQQDEQAQYPEHKHGPGHADQRQSPTERPGIHLRTFHNSNDELTLGLLDNGEYLLGFDGLTGGNF